MAVAVSILIGAGFGLAVYNWLFAKMVVRRMGRIMRELREDVQNIHVNIGCLSGQIAKLNTTPESPVRRGGL